MKQVYNRYIPQSDGTYRRRRVQDQHNENTPSARDTTHLPSPQEEPPGKAAPTQRPFTRSGPKGQNIEGFLRQILPKDFDTGDLLVILLLLLMSGDNKVHQNNALLTLALYLFM